MDDSRRHRLAVPACIVFCTENQKQEDCMTATNGACCQSMQHPIPDASQFALSRCWQAARHRQISNMFNIYDTRSTQTGGLFGQIIVCCD